MVVCCSEIGHVMPMDIRRLGAVVKNIENDTTEKDDELKL